MVLKKSRAAVNEPGLEDVKRQIAEALGDNSPEPEKVALKKYIEMIRKYRVAAKTNGEKILELKAKLKEVKPKKVPRRPAEHVPVRYVDPRLKKGKSVANVEAGEPISLKHTVKTEAQELMLAKAKKNKAKTRGVRKVTKKI